MTTSTSSSPDFIYYTSTTTPPNYTSTTTPPNYMTTNTSQNYTVTNHSPLSLGSPCQVSSYITVSAFPIFIKTVEREDCKDFLFAVPNCTKQNVDVTYVEQDSFFKVEAENGELFTSIPCTIAVNTNKLDLSKIECYVKDGLLTVVIPYFEESIPKSVKIN